MRVKFLGVGEAFDEELPNTSIWVRAGSGHQRSSVLLDCGFTAPPAFWRSCADPNDLDGIWISHFHADHYFGLPALLTRFWEANRTKPLLILGQHGVDEIVPQMMQLAYSSILQKLQFQLRFRSAEPKEAIEALGLNWRTAVNGHSHRDLAVRIESEDKSVFYSGDGGWTEDTLILARGCDLLIHEAFSLDENIPGHGNIMNCIDFARAARAGALALVHIRRHDRHGRRDEILRVLENVKDLKVFMPEPGEELGV